MKTTLEERLAAASANMKLTAQKAFKHPISSILSLCLVAGMAATIAGFSQTSDSKLNTNTPRVITAITGEALAVKLVNKTADSVEVIRLNDNKRVKIPLDRLCTADQTLIAAWDPTPIQDYRPSSVSIAGSPGIQRKSYPSMYQPRYVSGTGRAGASNGNGGGGGRKSCRTYQKSCTKRTVTTIVIPGRCPPQAAPCPKNP